MACCSRCAPRFQQPFEGVVFPRATPQIRLPVTKSTATSLRAVAQQHQVAEGQRLPPAGPAVC
ncbi:MAG: hypothetical protein U0836_26320 [Pirellulales bacterium]